MSDYRQQQECEEQELWIELEYKPNVKLTQAELKRLWNYDPLAGLFTRLVKTNPSGNVGDIANCHSGNGYIGISIACKHYQSHRLAFLYMTGKWPKLDVDHINGIKDDNRWCNLRDVSRSVNQQNKKIARSDNVSGYLGVSWHKTSNKWRARITLNKKQIYLGNFKNAHDAAECYLQKKRELHAGCTI